MTSSAAVALPVGPVVQAVVAYDGTLPSAAGIQLVGTLPALRMAVVRGQVGALAGLSRRAGVRGLSLDDAVTLSDHDVHTGGLGHLASEGLGNGAGAPGAGAGVRVAVVDTGVSDTAALNRASGRLVDAADASTPGVVRTGGTYTDGFGHGTFMAGLVAGGPLDALDGRALGVAPAATVLVVRIARPDGSTSLSRVLGGLDWVAAHPSEVDVVSLSLSHRRPGPRYGADPLTAAVERVHEAGVTIAVSAGNVSGVVSDPGFDPLALTVGAADLDRHRVAPFSGSARVLGIRKPDVVANGVDVLGLLPTGSVIEQAEGTAHLPGGLFRGSGTSQATAVTAGAAALVLAAHPGATPAQVKGSLRCAAEDLRGLRDGAGLLTVPSELCAAADGQALDGSGDTTGESDFDANAWGANAWGAVAWGANAWGANAWGANAWAANAWAANAWAANAWAANAWAANAWAANAWAANAWGGRE
jgi:serine protease AprX